MINQVIFLPPETFCGSFWDVQILVTGRTRRPTECPPQVPPVAADLRQADLDFALLLHWGTVTQARAQACPLTGMKNINIDINLSLSASPVGVHYGPAVVDGDVDEAACHQLGLAGVGDLLLLPALHQDGHVPHLLHLLHLHVTPPLPGRRRGLTCYERSWQSWLHPPLSWQDKLSFTSNYRAGKYIINHHYWCVFLFFYFRDYELFYKI